MIEQYKILHKKNAGYGSGATYAKTIMGLAQSVGCETILDYGCGKGKLSDKIESLTDIKCTRYDPAIEEFSDAPIGDFDMVICNDVLEHLNIHTARTVMSDIEDRARKLAFFNISCRLAHQILPNGENAHCLVMSEPRWCRVIGEIFKGETWSARSEFHKRNQNLVMILSRR